MLQDDQAALTQAISGALGPLKMVYMSHPFFDCGFFLLTFLCVANHFPPSVCHGVRPDQDPSVGHDGCDQHNLPEGLPCAGLER